jgi:hypothetical protein
LNAHPGDAGHSTLAEKATSLASVLASAAEGPCAPRVSAQWLILMDTSLPPTIILDVPTLDAPLFHFLSHPCLRPEEKLSLGCSLPMLNLLQGASGLATPLLVLLGLRFYRPSLQASRPQASSFEISSFKSNVRSPSYRVSNIVRFQACALSGYFVTARSLPRVIFLDDLKQTFDCF